MNRRTFVKAGAGLMAAAPVRSQEARSTAPAAPRLTLNVRDFGATGDGTTKDTAAIQQAIDRCSVLGGGEVLVPAGNYLTGRHRTSVEHDSPARKGRHPHRHARFRRLSRLARSAGKATGFKGTSA